MARIPGAHWCATSPVRASRASAGWCATSPAHASPASAGRKRSAAELLDLVDAQELNKLFKDFAVSLAKIPEESADAAALIEARWNKLGLDAAAGGSLRPAGRRNVMAHLLHVAFEGDSAWLERVIISEAHFGCNATQLMKDAARRASRESMVKGLQNGTPHFAAMKAIDRCRAATVTVPTLVDRMQMTMLQQKVEKIEQKVDQKATMAPAAPQPETEGELQVPDGMADVRPGEQLPFPRIQASSCPGRTSGLDKASSQDAVEHRSGGGGCVLAVADGHGEGGEAVAKALALTAAERVARHHVLSDEDWAKLFADLQQSVSHEIGGSTLSVVHVAREFVSLAWVGDTQMLVLLRDGAWQLTPKHVLSEPGELQIVQANGGRVVDVHKKLPDQSDVVVRRLLGGGGDRLTGLTVSRSLGDKDYPALHRAPTTWRFRRADVAAVWAATDGLWDVAGTCVQEVVSTLSAEKLVMMARASWLHQTGGVAADDITVATIQPDA